MQGVKKTQGVQGHLTLGLPDPEPGIHQTVVLQVLTYGEVNYLLDVMLLQLTLGPNARQHQNLGGVQWKLDLANFDNDVLDCGGI